MIQQVFTLAIVIGLGVILGYYDSILKPLVQLVMQDLPVNLTGRIIPEAVYQAANTSSESEF